MCRSQAPRKLHARDSTACCAHSARSTPTGPHGRRAARCPTQQRWPGRTASGPASSQVCSRQLRVSRLQASERATSARAAQCVSLWPAGPGGILGAASVQPPIQQTLSCGRSRGPGTPSASALAPFLPVQALPQNEARTAAAQLPAAAGWPPAASGLILAPGPAHKPACAPDPRCTPKMRAAWPLRPRTRPPLVQLPEAGAAARSWSTGGPPGGRMAPLRPRLTLRPVLGSGRAGCGPLRVQGPRSAPRGL